MNGLRPIPCTRLRRDPAAGGSRNPGAAGSTKPGAAGPPPQAAHQPAAQPRPRPPGAAGSPPPSPSRSHGAARMLLARASASSSGLVPLASMATRVSLAASSMAPRAIVRLPSERISTIRRATTGKSSTDAGRLCPGVVVTLVVVLCEGGVDMRGRNEECTFRAPGSRGCQDAVKIAETTVSSLGTTASLNTEPSAAKRS